MRHVDSRHRMRKLGFFWQLILAFVLIIMLAVGGLIFAAFFVMQHPYQGAVELQPAPMVACVTELTDYYALYRDWEGAEEVLLGAACSTMMVNKESSFTGEFALVSADGRVIATPHCYPVGRSLRASDRTTRIPIRFDEEDVAFLAIPPSGRFDVSVVTMQRSSRPRFFTAVAMIAAVTLLASFVVSRAMSRPLSRLTRASQAVAAGDLSVRVATRYPGEVGELAYAFNRMTSALAYADELRRNMTADVAHELRTPLSVIRGKLEGMLDGVYPSTPEHLEPVLEETRLLARLVDDLHLLALAEAGQLPLEKRPLQIVDVLRDVCVNFEPQAGDRDVALLLDVPDALPKVLADWRRIVQVLGNLVTNALRHTPSGGRVTLSASLRGSWVEVAVSDTGSGIPKDSLPHIFERFWRGEKSRTRSEGGSGLGLAIVRQLVELHDGTVGIQSEVGVGTRIWFTLPTVK